MKYLNVFHNRPFKYPYLFFIVLMFAPDIVNAQAWVNVGKSDFSAGHTQFNSIAVDSMGTPYVFYEDDVLGAGVNGKGTVMKYDGTNWVAVGKPAFTDSTVWYTKIAIDRSGTPYVAFADDSNGCCSGKAKVMKYDGSNWVTVGSGGFSASYINGISLAIDNSGTPYVAYVDGAGFKATVMKYNGVNWVNVGSPEFSAGAVGSVPIIIDPSGTLYVAYTDFAYGKKATVMKYDGSSWIPVGASGFTLGEAGLQSLAIDKSGVPYIVFADSINGDKATVMKFNGSSWVNVGAPGFSTGVAAENSIVLDTAGTPFVVYTEGIDNKLTVMKYNGTSWIIVGTPMFSVGSMGVYYPSIAIDKKGTPFVSFADYTNGSKANVMKLETVTKVSNNSGSTRTVLSMFPNPNHGSFEINIPTATNEDAKIVITNIVGQTIKEISTVSNKSIKIDLDVEPGMYFVSALTSDGYEYSKLIVNK